MTDPLDALRAPIRPVDPDPAFARALRTRLERALLDRPVEDTVTSTQSPTMTPYLAVLDARAAVEFYVDVFGARRRGAPIIMPDGRVGHVEVEIGDSVLMLAEEFPEMGLLAPVSRGGPSQSLHVEVADPDAVVAAAVAAGAALERPVADSPHGRGGVVLDASGHRWMVSREPPRSRPGDVVYAALWTPDVERAARFYTAVLGWALTSSDGGRGRLVDGGPPLGIHAHDGLPTTMLCHAVPDVDAAVDLVRAAGGSCAGAVDEPHGRTALCADDQGLPFALGTAGPTPHGEGDLAYVEIRVPDAGRARAFYGTVLGWRFTPGAQAGYWHPSFADGSMTRPAGGLVGGHPAPAVVSTFRVRDIGAATTAVRAAGGSAADPTDSRHGVIAECVDDQGSSFMLTDHIG